MGYPVISTWCKAIDKGYFSGWNGLTSNRTIACLQTRSYGPTQSLPTFHQEITQYVSTQPDHMFEQPQTPNNDKTNMVYMTTVEVDVQLFTKQTGHFPLTSNCGNNYIIIFYAVDPNFIKSYPIKSRHRSKLLKAYTDVYQFLRVSGHRPQLHR
eukprot:CCRYP_015561-RA/>CCRYP_015561-RA protein AED:0.45 eAED:0.55 QI:0/0/0/1/0/0/2/0/153